MYIKTQEGLICNNNDHFYLNDNDFMFNKINYERDEGNGRCYRLDESSCLRADCDGKLVRRRITNKFYFECLNKLKRMIPTKEEMKNYQ